MSGGPQHIGADESDAARVLDNLVLEYLERKQLSGTAATFRQETGLQHADQGFRALPYCFLSSWFCEFWDNWYLKRTAGLQTTAIAQAQNPALNNAMTAAAAAGDHSRPSTPLHHPLWSQSQASTRASTPSAASHFTLVAPPAQPQLGSHNSGSAVSPGSLASMQPASSLHSTHSEAAEDLLAMSQRLLASSSANGALSQRVAGGSPDLHAGPGANLLSPFQQQVQASGQLQATLSGSTTAQLGMLNMNSPQHSAGNSHPSPTGTPMRRNLSSIFHPSSSQADAGQGLRGHHSASFVLGQQQQQQHHHHQHQQQQQQQQQQGANRPQFTQFTPDFAPFTTMMSGQLESPKAPLRARSYGGLHPAPSAPPAAVSPHTPPTRKRKVQLQGDPPLPQALTINTGGSSLYAQGGEQLGSQRMSEGSEQTICSPQFMLPLDLDILNSLTPGDMDKPQHAHSMPAALDQDCNLHGLDGLLPLLDGDDLNLPGDSPRAGAQTFI